MPLQATSGAASYDAFGGGVPVVPNYIEDVFSTWLYTGNGSTQTINNGIDLAGKGGLVWTKSRAGASSHYLFDNTRPLDFSLSSNTTGAQEEINNGNPLTFNSNGFSLPNSSDVNSSGVNYASWTFREQPKFFDVVTWSGNAASTRVISHNLGSTPGCIIVKSSDSVGDWLVYHRSQGVNKYGYLNGTDLWRTDSTTFKAVSDTTFTVGSWGDLNGSGKTFVAYIFAHDAGGFGLTGTDNVISCGSFTASSGAATVDLGYEPQWILFKRTNGVGGWYLTDNMRGWSYSATAALLANTSDAEDPNALIANPTATGFQFGTGTLVSSGAYIYIAIRRGPMRTPTTGTSVFDVTTAGTNTNISLSGRDFDAYIGKFRSGTDNGSGIASTEIIDRLRGLGVYTSWAAGNTSPSPALRMASTAAEASTSNMGIVPSSVSGTGNLFLVTRNSSDSNVLYGYRRAPGFMDVCCYTGTGVYGRTINHNLGVVPELIIVKQRSLPRGWAVYSAAIGNTRVLQLNTTAGQATDDWFANTTPTSTVFSVGSNQVVNENTQTFVAYLFASCPGVSKVFNYTGNGSSQTINCGFTGGARFVMIKRTDSTGDWYVWDTARGIVSGNDPRLSLNTTAAEVTTDDSVDTDSTGFVVNQLSATNINVSSATYIGLAIA